jgi:hypothetical protein
MSEQVGDNENEFGRTPGGGGVLVRAQRDREARPRMVVLWLTWKTSLVPLEQRRARRVVGVVVAE